MTAADAGVSARYDANVVPRSVSNQVVIDREAASIVYQVVDNRTSQVVKQFPEEAVLRRRAYFHTLDLTREGAERGCAPPTAGPDNRSLASGGLRRPCRDRLRRSPGR